jgi:hypothetical protein
MLDVSIKVDGGGGRRRRGEEEGGGGRTNSKNYLAPFFT